MPRLRAPRKAALILALLVAALAVPGSARWPRPAAGRPPRPADSSVRLPAARRRRGVVRAVTRRTACARCPASATSAGCVGLCSLGHLRPGRRPEQHLLTVAARSRAGRLRHRRHGRPARRPASSRTPSTRKWASPANFWAATDLQCSDSTSLIGNDVAGVVFDAAKSLDRVTITIYQSAAGNGILSWLSNAADRLITGLGNAIYFPYLAVVVIIGAIWLAWQGLIRKRGTRTIEGTVWMVVAAAAAIFLIGKPADGHRPGPGRLQRHQPDPERGVRQAAEPRARATACRSRRATRRPGRPTSPTPRATPWSTRTPTSCGPCWSASRGWTASSAPTSSPSRAATRADGGQHLRPVAAVGAGDRRQREADDRAHPGQAGHATPGSRSSLEEQRPRPSTRCSRASSGPPGWRSRSRGLFAALVAGLLILLISVTLILLKLGFLLLLIAGPFFLLIGTHPGFGRVIALRWVEMLIGVLLKQAAVALTLSVLLYCYALIMGTSDAVLPWALKILMIALVTVAAFIYRQAVHRTCSRRSATA